MNYAVQVWQPAPDGVGGEWRTIARGLERADAMRLARATPGRLGTIRVTEWRGGMNWQRVWDNHTD